MNTLLQDITDRAMKLDANDRVTLARHLLDSVEGPIYDDATHAELQRRDEEMSSGAVTGVPREEVMQRLRAKFECE